MVPERDFGKLIGGGRITYREIIEELVRQAYGRKRETRFTSEDEDAFREALGLWVGDEEMDGPVTIGKYLELWDALTAGEARDVEESFYISELFAGCKGDNEAADRIFNFCKKSLIDKRQGGEDGLRS